MNKIQKTVSLEDYKSRMSGVINAIAPDGSFVTFSREMIFNEIEGNKSNYGMIPSDVLLDNTPLSNMVNSGEAVSYHTLKEWFHFLEKMVNRLAVEVKCGVKTYDSIDEFLGNEKEEISYEDEEKFNKLGGKKSYEWLCENVFIRFLIPSDFVNEWNVSYLFLNDFFKWYGWFTERYDKYSDKSEKECIDSYDCCDCKDYFRLGGNAMYSSMKKWAEETKITNYAKQTSSITRNNIEYFLDIENVNGEDKLVYANGSSYSGVVSTDDFIKVQDFSGFINLPIYLGSEIDDLGELSLLAEEWENLKDYSITKETEEFLNKSLGYVDIKDKLGASGGTIVIHNDKDYILNDINHKGFYFSKRFKEGYFGYEKALSVDEKNILSFTKKSMSSDDYDENGNLKKEWDRYFTKYVNKNINDFKKYNTECFSYKDNKLILNPTPFDMADSYVIEKSDGGFIMDNKSIYHLIISPYILYGKHYLVNYEDGVPYINNNGRKMYGIVKMVEENGVVKPTYVFNLSKVDCVNGGVDVDIIKEGKFLFYKDKYIFCGNVSDNINSITIKKINGKIEVYDVFNNYVTNGSGIIPLLKSEEYNGQFIPCKYNVKYDEKTNSNIHFLEVDNFAFNAISPLNVKVENGVLKEIEGIDVDKTTTNSSNLEKVSKLHGYFTIGDSFFIQKPYQIYNTDFISGTTESHLSIFGHLTNAYDDLGNLLPGNFMLDTNGKTFEAPKEGGFLELPFEIGSVTNLSDLDELEDANMYGDNEPCIIDDISALETESINVDVNVEEVETDALDRLLRKLLAEEDVKEEKIINKENFYKDYFWGDILTSIELYIKDEFGNKIFSVLLDINNSVFDGKNVSYNILYRGYNYLGWATASEEDVPNHSTVRAIKFLLNKYNDYKDNLGADFSAIHGNFEELIHCDIEYYLGAIISRENNFIEGNNELLYYGTYKLSYLDDGKRFDDVKNMSFEEKLKRYNPNTSASEKHHHYGVRYVEECVLKERICPYEVDETNSFTMFYYDIERPLKAVEIRNEIIKKEVSRFETSIMALKNINGDLKGEVVLYDEELPTSGYVTQTVYDESYVDDNGFIVAPTIREQYRLGITSNDKVNGDIYIDRGNAQSFDKHLKLLSCKSFSALERYGNGYFNINES